MEYKLLEGNKPDSTVFSLSITNLEQTVRITPSRAFKRVSSEFDRSYFTEVFLPVKKRQLKGGNLYQQFDLTIEAKLRKKELKNNVNIISFFGDKETHPSDIANFEDLGLLSNFEALFNDHMICMPFSTSLYDTNYDDILSSVTSTYDDFASTLHTHNVFGYIPAYVHYNEMEKYLNFYSKKASLNVRKNGTILNGIPLMVDMKRSNPDNYRRTLAKLLDLKLKFISDGFYPIYYAYSVGRPRLSKTKASEIAKDFLLSFLGFDIIGASHAIIPPEKLGGGPSRLLKFDLRSFKYLRSDVDYSYKADKAKAEVFHKQSQYLGRFHEGMAKDDNYVKNELRSRSEASDYIDFLSQRR